MDDETKRQYDCNTFVSRHLSYMILSEDEFDAILNSDKIL